MKYIKILLILPMLFLLAGCGDNKPTPIDEKIKQTNAKIIEELVKSNVVTSYEAPVVYVNTSWGGLYVKEKEVIAGAFVDKFNSKVIFKDTYSGKILMKCGKNKKCKMYNYD